MMILPIREPWFSMILRGGKSEEYRNVKPYYTVRFRNVGLLDENSNPNGKTLEIMLRNGYSHESAYLCANVTLEVGKGKTEWGAKPGKTYYILKIHKITEFCTREQQNEKSLQSIC